MRRVIEYKRVPYGQKTKWLKDRHISRSNMQEWTSKLPEWESMTQEELKANKSGNKRGMFHDMEVLLYDIFLKRRADGWRVSYAYITAQMRILCNKHKPPKYDPNRHKFKDAWVRRFCRRWNISLRKKSNAKCKSVFERLHQVKNYDWWLIYKFQNPDNFDDPYFSFEEFVEKEVLDTEQDKELGSEEDPLEPSEETNSSSED